MANLSIMNRLPERITELYRELENKTSKLHWIVETIGFIKKALHYEFMPKFAQVKGNFMNVNDRYKSENCILLSHLHDNVRSNKLLIKKPYLLNKLKQECGALSITAVLRYIWTLQQKQRMDSFITKSYILKRLI